MINGFLNINKPDGITSFGVISKLRKRFGIKKFGHMGTLDPAGCGVLPVAVGKATRLFDLMQQKRKTYRAIFVFGQETDTLDAEGVIVNRSDVLITKDEIEKKLPLFIGKINQKPPNFSAKKVNGKRAYELARQNQEFNLESKEIEIFDFKLLDELERNVFLFEIVCSSGTYVRSLCRDLSNSLNSVAYMPLIIRTNCDFFGIENSISFKKMLEDQDGIENYLIKIDEVIQLEKLILNEKEYKKIKNGQEIQVSNMLSGLKYLVYDGRIFSIGKVSNDKLKMEIYLDD